MTAEGVGRRFQILAPWVLVVLWAGLYWHTNQQFKATIQMLDRCQAMVDEATLGWNGTVEDLKTAMAIIRQRQ